ncbi:MAG: ornithine racemase Orr [Clostridiales bacterium]|nr:ornithine racemase Orr [Clostridiales bacterium]MDY4060456.1 ornithine racemase Orr [Anaerovoracaceae bacterium]
MYPRILIDITKLRDNIKTLAKIIKNDGKCSLMIVTKGMCADPEMVKMLVESPEVDFVADSRIKNIASYSKTVRDAGKKTVLIRIPMLSEADEIVKHVDLCFNSEMETVRAINQAAQKVGKVQDVLLMVDLGDLREGIFFKNEDEILKAADEIKDMKNVNLYGIGVNLTCYGAIIPKNDNLSQLVEIGRKIEEHTGKKLEMISGGNSSSIYLIESEIMPRIGRMPKDEKMPEGINNLRLGEAFLLGNDTAYETEIPETHHDAIKLQAEIIELKEKPSLPIGEVGVDAFGEKPYYEDKGIMKRAIIAVGKQDTDLGSMTPVDDRIEIMGGSSDHIILDLTACGDEYKVGDIVEFTVGYGGMLKLATSPYVDREYVK